MLFFSSFIYSQELKWLEKYSPGMLELYTVPNIIAYDNKIIKIDFIRRLDGADIYGGNKIQFSYIDKDNGNIIESKLITLSHPVLTIRAIKKYNESEFIIYGEKENNKFFYCIINLSGELIKENFMEIDNVNLGYIFQYIVDEDYNFIATYNDKKEGLICKYNLDFEIIDSLRVPFVIEDTSLTYPSIYLWVHCQTKDGGYLFSYRHMWPFENNYVFKTDINLNIIKSFELQSFLYPNYDVDKFLIRFIDEKDDGSYFVVMNNSNNLADYRDSTFALLNLDSDGNILLKNFYGGKTIYDLDKEEPQMRIMSAVDFKKDELGNYIIGCSFRFPVVLKSDQFGNKIWQRMYNVLDSNLLLGLNKINIISEKTIALCVSDYQEFVDEFFNKYKKQVNSYIYFVEDNTNYIDEESQFDNNIILFPNPNSGEFKVGLSYNSNPRLFSLEIYDVIGDQVYYKNDINGFININIRNKPSGIYMIKIIIGSNVLTKHIIKID